MPELPEVEVVCRYLRSNIVEKKIHEINVFADKLVKNVSVEELKNFLVGQIITNIRRRGKYILIDFEKNTIVSHLRMEGKWKIQDKNYNLNKHDHIIIDLEDSVLVYNDSRMFGTIEIVDFEDEYSLKGINKIGPEYDDEILTPEYVHSRLNKRKQAIKTALLTQEIFTGLGNIYVDEVLFEAKIMPNVSSCDITIEKCEQIIKWSQKIMNKSIKYGGSTIKSYSSGKDREGTYQQFLNVYGRDGQNCNVCGQIISKMKLNGRGTHFCLNCQNGEN